jgi:arylsulfatase A-like enzyme
MSFSRGLAVLAGGMTFMAQAVSKPNIIYILADDMGVGDVAALGEDAKVKTPNLDGLVVGGMHFTDAHTGSAVCTPTRYGLLTGRYNWRSELKKGVLDGYSRALIPSDRETVGKLLQRNGYATAMIGKWHLGMTWTKKDGSPVTELKPPKGTEGQINFSKPFRGGPVDCGFDYFYGINASLDFPPYTWLENDRVVKVPSEKRPGQGGKKAGAPQIMMRGGVQAPGFAPELILKGLTEKTVEYIEQSKAGKPFFLYLPLNAPHTPVVPRDGFVGKSACGIYGDFIQEIDWSIGEIVAALRQKGILENTMIVFTADNGASPASFPLEQEKEFGHKPSHIYKGRKGSLNEGGHRVPFIVQWPAAVKKGSRCDTACSLNDLYATCAALVGAEVAPNAGEDSFNILPLLEGEDGRYRRNGMVYHDFGGRFAFRDGRWKLITSKFTKKRALYDLEADPSETDNLYAEHPEIVSRLENKLTRIVLDGRSTPGAKLDNDGPEWWEQLIWIDPSP